MMVGRGKKMVSLLCIKANTIVLALIVSTILSIPDAVHGLTSDQTDPISTPEALVNPELIQDSNGEPNNGQKRFSTLLEWMVDPAGYAGKQDFGENLKQLWLEPLQLISPSSLLNKEERARRGGGKMWSKGDVKDNASRVNNRKIFIRI